MILVQILSHFEGIESDYNISKQVLIWFSPYMHSTAKVWHLPLDTEKLIIHYGHYKIMVICQNRLQLLKYFSVEIEDREGA